MKSHSTGNLIAAIMTLGLFAGTAFGQDDKPAAEANAPAADKPESLVDRISYSYGVVIARQMKERGIELNIDQFAKAFTTITEGAEPALTQAEIESTFNENQKMLDIKNATGEDKETLIAGQKFLEENGKKEGIKTTASGLQYEVIKAGDGEKPKATDKVTVHYHGTLLDGKVFDSSVDRGQPATFGLNQVIPGWTEGVQLIPQGGKYRFFIPYDLAYGARGAGADIKPYSTLIFEVELLKIGE